MLEDKRNESEMDFEGTDVRGAGRGVLRAVWICGDEPVELVNAGSVRLALDHLLAGSGHFDTKQDPLRRLSWRTTRPAHVLAPPHEGTLGTYDPRGAREIP